MALYPTEDWLNAYRDAINERFEADPSLRTGSRGFSGNLLYVITDVPVDETTVGDLPPEVFDGLPKSVRAPLSTVALDEFGSLLARPLFSVVQSLASPLSLAGASFVVRGQLRQALPERTAALLTELDNHVIDGTIYAFVSLVEGVCTQVALLDEPYERVADFVLRGRYETWSRIVDGETDVLSAVGQSDLIVDGDGNLLVDHYQSMVALGEAAASVETTRMF